MSSTQFKRWFRWLIVLTWNIPPIIGFSFILLLGVMTPQQVKGVLQTPFQPIYIIAWSTFVFWFFPQKMQPLSDWLDKKPEITAEHVIARVRSFSLWYWGLFILYLLVAPLSVMLPAELYTDFVMTPVALFRIEMIALIVSIIVGLPIYFLIMDLFGRAIGKIVTERPVLTIRVKVFLIGALTPLLIDTILVQYFWTRTGFFTIETFGMWLVLELLAIIGSLMFMRSFGQSLSPLQNIITNANPLQQQSASIESQSVDELGLLSTEFKRLIQELKTHNKILAINNKMLQGGAVSLSLEDLADTAIELCHQSVYSDLTFLLLCDDNAEQLVGIAHTGSRYKPDGHYRIDLAELSLPTMVFQQQEAIVIQDLRKDPRCHSEFCQRFQIRSVLATPLRSEGQTLGVLMATTQEREHSYTQQEIKIFKALALEVAIALYTQTLTQERREKNEQIALLLNTAEEGIYGVDLKGFCTFINSASLRMLGYNDKSELLGRPIHDLIHHTLPNGDPYPREQCKIRLATKEGASIHSLDEFHWRKDGTPFPIEFWSHPIRRDGEITGTVVTFIDITERLQVEQELASYRNDLEVLVKKRTMELNRVNKELESFSYSVSHDLRAPLRAINGLSLALLEDYHDDLDDTGRDYLHRVRGGTERMALLIDDLLALSRVSRTKVKPVTVDFEAIAYHAIQQLQKSEPKRSVHVTIEKELVANADQRLMEVALNNILSNAWKYTNKTPQAEIYFGKRQEDSRVVFYIKDNGAGFDMRYVGKLFEPFQRLHSLQDFEGHGIGLATVQRIINLHGGSVWADAAVDQGATFFFTLD